jgi:hypothetical protein
VEGPIGRLKCAHFILIVVLMGATILMELFALHARWKN